VRVEGEGFFHAEPLPHGKTCGIGVGKSFIGIPTDDLFGLFLVIQTDRFDRPVLI